MKNFTSLVTTTLTCAALSAVSFNSYAMDKYIENALIDVCKSTLTNNVRKFSRTVKSYNLRDQTVAMKVVCNGDDIIDFAEKRGANNTAARLERSINRHVNIIDVASIEKVHVRF